MMPLLSVSGLVRKWVARLLTVGVVSLLAISALANDNLQQDNMFQIIDWNGYDAVVTLQDGTAMYAYIAEVNSYNISSRTGAEHNSIFRFSFLPRFQCSPLIVLVGTLAADAGEEERIASLRNFNRIKLEIDGEPMAYPALVERQKKEIHSFYNANLQRRTSLRILSELGNNMQVEFGDGTVEEFSLLGSRKALEQALGRCKNHG